MEKELEILKQLAKQAGSCIMEIYSKDTIDVEYKRDNSPLTLADKIANTVIVQGISKHFPLEKYGILTEEDRDDLSRLKKEYCFIIDPLDGTKEFIKRNGEFTVNIALAYKGEVILGVIYVPVLEELYYAAKGYGAYLMNKDGKPERIRVSTKTDNLCITKSRSHSTDRLEALIRKNNIKDIIEIGSSLKGCLVARGKAEVYYRFGPTKEWDTAAMQCIAEEAGAIFRQMDHTKMCYNRENSVNDKGFYVINNEKNLLI